MATNIKIKPYDINNLPEVLEIINFYILTTTAIYDYDARTLEQQKSIFNEKINNNYPVIIAIVNNKVAGFAYFDSFRKKDGYKFTAEHSVYVHPNFTGIGIGKKLLEQLIILAKEKNIRTLIGVIDAENTNSIDFHLKMGFEIKGTLNETGYKFNRWLDSVFVLKIIN